MGTPQSITFNGIMELVKCLAPEDKFATFTSHDLRRVLVAKGIDPKRTYADFYSYEPPDVAITYTWDTDIRKEMTKFFLEIQNIVSLDKSCGREKFTKAFEHMTFWIDIFFIDQNDTQNIGNALIEAVKIYSHAPYHFVLLLHSLLLRGWCLFEIGARTQSVMDEFRLTHEEVLEIISKSIDAEQQFYSIRSFEEFPASYISKRKLPLFLAVSGLTDFDRDITQFKDRDDAMDRMTTTKEEDQIEIRKRLRALLRSRENFNSVIKSLACSAFTATEGMAKISVLSDSPVRFPWTKEGKDCLDFGSWTPEGVLEPDLEGFKRELAKFSALDKVKCGGKVINLKYKNGRTWSDLNGQPDVLRCFHTVAFVLSANPQLLWLRLS